jgi:hypothetical protein
MRTLRGEWFLLPSRAKHADRAMRTLAARATAQRVYAETIGVAGAGAQTLLATLAKRPGWRRAAGQEFVHTFGARQSAINLPARFDAVTVASLAVRAEINTLLGDCNWPLLSALQDLAARELQHLASSR